MKDDKQLTLPALVPVLERDINGIVMGILEDSTPYMTETGLAAFCGVARMTISRHADSWASGDRTSEFAKIVIDKIGADIPTLYFKVQGKSGVVNAYPDNVCAVFLEYYAFVSKNKTDIALARARALLHFTIRSLIYRSTGYDPLQDVSPRWKPYTDRIALNPEPAGFFSVFREMAELMVPAIHAGLPTDSHTVPDCSVGDRWSTYWISNSLESKYGKRVKRPHKFPASFPTGKAGVEPEICVYPIEALGSFRKWLHREYIPKHFPEYLKYKARLKTISLNQANNILEAFGVARLPEPKTNVIGLLLPPKKPKKDR